MTQGKRKIWVFDSSSACMNKGDFKKSNVINSVSWNFSSAIDWNAMKVTLWNFVSHHISS